MNRDMTHETIRLIDACTNEDDAQAALRQLTAFRAAYGVTEWECVDLIIDKITRLAQLIQDINQEPHERTHITKEHQE